MPHSSPSGRPMRVEELDHLGRARGGADVERGQLVHPELLAQGGRIVDAGPGLDRDLELLEDPRHAEEPRRADLGEVADDLARVRAAGDREAELHREVVRAVALGDVRHRQVGDDVAAAREVQHRVVGAHREQHALVGELDALRVAGRARGVDQRQQVVGLDRLPGGVEVEVRVALELVEQVDLDHVLGASRGRGSSARRRRSSRPSRAGGTRPARARRCCRSRTGPRRGASRRRRAGGTRAGW